MLKYDAKVRHMIGNLYEGPRSHRGKYLNIDMHKHHLRECHTYSRTHTYTHSIDLILCPSLHPAQRTNIDWRLHTYVNERLLSPLLAYMSTCRAFVSLCTVFSCIIKSLEWHIIMH